MRRSGRVARLARLPLAVLLAVAATAATGVAGSPRAADALSSWAGGMDLYRAGAFSTQQSWLWCTAADVQIIRNLVRHDADHSAESQSRYFAYMRAHDRYAIPVSDGTEPSGWAAGLRRYVDARYQVVQDGSFDAALRSAVTSLRRTNRPVGLLVAHGDHAWVLTGFTATADPARTSRFTVTSVRVVGPLWGLQSRSYGYDMPPDTRLTPSQLRGFFTPWHYARVRMAWEGTWVSIQAIPARPRPVATASSHAIVKASPKPTPKPTPKPAPAAAAPSAAGPSASGAPATSLSPADTLTARVAPVGGAPGPASADPDALTAADPATTSAFDAGVAPALVLGASALVVLGVSLARLIRRRPPGAPRPAERR